VASASASGISTGCPLSGVSSISPDSEPAAQADAASLLAELPLPPGSTESSSEPANDDSLLAHPASYPATPNLVDDHAWWLVPVAPAEALAYVCAHLAGGTRSVSVGKGESGPNVPENEIAELVVPGSPGTLVITVVRLPDASTALRADAQVVWVTPRPASDTIPGGAHLLRIAVHAPNTHYPKSFEPDALLERLPWKITSVAQIEAIVALLNGLEVAQPGARLCPLERAADSNVELSFYASANAAPLALADIHLEGCGGVSVVIGGLRRPPLEGGSDLISPIAGILGVKASAGPPVGLTPHISMVHMSADRFGVEAEETVTVGVEPGTEFLFDLSAPAEVSISISRLPRGSRFADTCLANAERPRRLRSEDCRRTVLVTRLTRLTEPAGEDGIAFGAKIGRRALALGRYVALLRARNTGGTSRVARVEFEITR
jgi:hypothetical protein